ncbi:MAG: GGDEF domain-containing protein [Gammaproteobacteria bacterium]|nr:GGDEF domain-containing protein [Gammaproteobacteria bacterium]MDH5594454.1 GGDEF domain-containing protein [Gammaproteobacteria bacterium]MDH5614056.1 GGDEF domain-containing protein [Gammaproteobacteria bacterium]
MITESNGARQILRLLDGLRKSRAGSVIFRHIERILDDVGEAQANRDKAYAGLLSLLLDAYAKHLSPDSALHVQIKLVQMRLTPPLSSDDLEALRSYIEVYAEQITHLESLDIAVLERALSPLLQEFGIASEIPEKPAPVETRPVYSELASSGIKTTPDDDFKNIRKAFQKIGNTNNGNVAETSESLKSKTEQRVDTAYRKHLTERQRNMQQFQQRLDQEVTEAIRQNDEFRVLLQIALTELNEAREFKDVEVLRQHISNEIEKVLESQYVLGSKLEKAHQSLQVFETGSQQLSEELDRVRVLSLTDELTALPNRRAFLRRLEDEAGRVQRYGYPLALAVIDLDKFKFINDHFGHSAGDAVLRSYAKSVLSIFRHHDMVCRYGGEEFAVLMPNTDQQGAVSALGKIQRRVSEMAIQHNNDTLKLPTFSAGLALYRPGEPPSVLIERADEALYHAKELGRDRIQLADNGEREPVAAEQSSD